MTTTIPDWTSTFADPATTTLAQSTLIYGHPDQDAQQWVGQQTGPEDCAVRCQEAIIKEFTGQDPGESQLSSEAQAHGWFDSSTGTPPEDVGLLLQLHGIAMHQSQNATVYDLEQELSHDHKVIVGVDAGVLWSNGTPDGHADHAVEATGLDLSDPNSPQVIINDPGVEHGAEDRYPLDQFMQAWSASGDLMVATDHAPAAVSPDHRDRSNGQPFLPLNVPAQTSLSWNVPEQISLPSMFDPGTLAGDEFGGLEHWVYDACSAMGDEMSAVAHVL